MGMQAKMARLQAEVGGVAEQMRALAARMDGGAAAAPSPIRASGPPSPRLGPTASAPILSPSAEQLRRENEQLRAALAVHERAAAAAAAARGGDDEEVGVFGGGELVGAVDV